MTSLGRKLWAFVRRDYHQEASYRVYFATQWGAILLNIVTYYYLARFVGDRLEAEMQPYGGDFFAFLLIGVALSGYQKVAVESFKSRIREAQMMGTFEALLATRTSPSVIIVCSAAYDFVVMSVRVLAYLLIGWLVFGLDVSRANYAGALVVLLLSVAAFLGVGVASSAFILLFKKGDPVSWIFTKLTVPLGGVLYPVAVLPGFLRVVSFVLPVTHALEGLRRTLLQGASLGEIRGSLAALALFALVVFPLSLLQFRLALRRSKVTGGLVQF